MKPETKKQKLADLLGIEIPPEPTREEARELEDSAFEQQAAIFFLENPLAFKERICLQCERTFQVNRQFVAVCSERCTTNYLAERGMAYNREREPSLRWARVKILGMNKTGEYIVEEVPRTMWDYFCGEPMIITPEFLEVVPPPIPQELTSSPEQVLVAELDTELSEPQVVSDPLSTPETQPIPEDVDEYIQGLLGVAQP